MAGLLPAAAGVLEVVELLPELAHADTVSARAASPAAPHIFRISDISPSQCKNDLPLEITYERVCQFTRGSAGIGPGQVTWPPPMRLPTTNVTATATPPRAS